jgi:hypothetical protein
MRTRSANRIINRELIAPNKPICREQIFEFARMSQTGLNASNLDGLLVEVGQEIKEYL